MSNEYPGVFSGLVEGNNDPDRMGRIKVRVPLVYGDSSQISTEQLPWALSRGLPNGGSSRSGGIDWLPEPGDLVWVTFLDGEPEKPLWEWANQSKPQTQKLDLHQYGATGRPKRAALTRYGHTIEINESSIILVSAKGNAILIDDDADGALIRVNQDILITAQDAIAMLNALQVSATGQIFFETEKGLSLKATDMAMNVTEDLIQYVGRYSLLVGSSLFSIIDNVVTLMDGSGSTVSLDGTGNIVIMSSGGTFINVNKDEISISTPDKSAVSIGNGGVTVSAQSISINGGNIALGQGARTPIVLTDLLQAFFNTHIHSNGNNGSPTGPPIVPMTAPMVGSTSTLAI